jgi:2-keto-4-pentenoate hydratase
VAGWKVALSVEYNLLIGALLLSRIFDNGATISTRDMTMVGVEAEIAFRFDQPLRPRERAYERAEIEALVTAFPAIEILDSRFRDYHGASVIDRAADFMSNSAFVVGAPRNDWRSFDLARLEAGLLIDGVEVARMVGGHAAGDALIPAIALANALRHSTGIPAGHVVTTGSYTGLKFIEKDAAVQAQFAGFGDVSCCFVP